MTAQTILPANSAATGGFNVDNSLRFDVASDDHLDRSQSTGNQTTYTVSFWIKRGVTGGQEYIVSAYYGNSSRYAYIRWNGDNNASKDCLDIFSGLYSTSSTSTSMAFKTNRKFRDPSAWYHIVLAVDTTQGTEGNRVKIYVNGVQETSFETATYPEQNQKHFLNINGTANEIGASNSASTLGSYLSEVVLIDGSQLAADQFGEFDEDSGIWKPIDVSGLTFGTNGFYLQFKGSGTSANSSGLGADTSGNDLHFTVSNLTAVDQSTDTCTNNFATLNPLSTGNKQAQRHVALSEGNLFAVGNSSSNNGNAYTTMAVNTGKWYCEIKATDVRGTGYPYIGVCNETCHNQGGQAGLDSSAGVDGVTYSPDGRKNINGTSSSYGNTFTDNDIIGIALDLDNGAVYFSKNGTFEASGDPTSGASKTNAVHTFTVGDYYFFAIAVFEAASDVSCNFGSPAFAISSSNTDGDGYGNFEYAVPSGYFALNTKNLAEYG